MAPKNNKLGRSPEAAPEEQEKEYIDQLLAQVDQTICPSCFAAGERTPLCRNMVLHKKEDGEHVLCCCWLGAKSELSPEEFDDRVQAMKNG